MNLSTCNDGVLVLTINSADELEIFIPPSKSKRVKLIVLPTATGDKTCKIGKYTFEHDQSAYRDVLATTDIRCSVGNCWRHTNNRLVAYVSGVPAAGETWIKQSDTNYVYYSIAAVTQTGAIVIKAGSARLYYEEEKNKTPRIIVQATVQQGGTPKAGVSVVYTITCHGKDPLVLAAVNSEANGLAKASKDMTVDSPHGNRITAIDSINIPTCKVSAAINGGTAVDIIAALPALSAKSGVPLRVDWNYSMNSDYTNKERLCECNSTSGIAVIGLNGDGSLRRVFNTGNPDTGDINLLFLPITNTGKTCTYDKTADSCTCVSAATVSCNIDGTDYEIDPTTFDDTVAAADLGCNADNCWQYDDSPITHRPRYYGFGNIFFPDAGEKWIKKTGNKYVLHIVQ